MLTIHKHILVIMCRLSLHNRTFLHIPIFVFLFLLYVTNALKTTCFVRKVKHTNASQITKVLDI